MRHLTAKLLTPSMALLWHRGQHHGIYVFPLGLWTWYLQKISKALMINGRSKTVQNFFELSSAFKQYTTCQDSPILARMGILRSFFVTMPHMDTWIPNVKPDSSAESFGDSFDTKHDRFVPICQKRPNVFAFDPVLDMIPEQNHSVTHPFGQRWV